MRRFSLSALVVSLLMALSLTAMAQEEGSDVIQESDKTVYKKKTIIDFSDVTIQGELTKPEGSYILNRKKTNFRTLLKIRGNFLPELYNSIDNL